MTRRVMVAVLVLIVACRKGDNPGSSPEAATVTVAQFRSLSWIEGRWKGTGGDVPPFYEGYRFINDSTLRTYSYADSVSPAPSDSGEIRLSGGTVTSGSDGRYVLTQIDDRSVTFDPRGMAPNAFRWERTSDTSWTAILRWRDASGPKERSYLMLKQGTTQP